MIELTWLTFLDVVIHFGLLILIWLVQVIIYPSFRYTDEADFKPWHSKYMRLITYFVLPMMFFQLSVSIWQLYTDLNVFNGLVLLLIIGVWGVTFFLSVPFHSQLLNKKESLIIEKLINTNWYRTIGWSLVFIIELSTLV